MAKVKPRGAAHPKTTQYAVDWVAFDVAAQARGAHRLTVANAAAPQQLAAPPGTRRGRGRLLTYSDETIRNMLFLALVSRMSLREVEGYVRALKEQAGYPWSVPDHTTLCRRMQTLQVTLPPAAPGERLVFLLDSTGLKLSGPGEWRGRHPRSGKDESLTPVSAAPPVPAAGPPPKQEPQKPPRRNWRKAHLAVEYGSGQIVSAVLTHGHASDSAQLPVLLANQPLTGAFVCADGAYHHEPEMQFVAQGGGKLLARPPYNASLWPERRGDPAIDWRDLQIAKRNELGQCAWAIASGYSKRSLIETHNARLKLFTGGGLRHRHENSQKVELVLRCQLLNAYQSLWTGAGGTRARAMG